MRTITQEMILTFKKHLITEEKASATILKYLYDIGEFAKWAGQNEINKELVLEYKFALTERYAPASVNAALASLNSFFGFFEWYDLKVKNLKIQKQIFTSTGKELTLGHSSVNTTRIYTMKSGNIYRQQIEKLGLWRC